jgi:hypothetical protein
MKKFFEMLWIWFATVFYLVAMAGSAVVIGIFVLWDNIKTWWKKK